MFMLYTYAHIACYGVQSKVFSTSSYSTCAFFLQGQSPLPVSEISLKGHFVHICSFTCVLMCVYMKMKVYCVYSQMILEFSC